MRGYEIATKLSTRRDNTAASRIVYGAVSALELNKKLNKNKKSIGRI